MSTERKPGFLEPKYMKCLQLEITNDCNCRCCHCSRLIGHHKKPFYMSLDLIEKALQTLVDFPGHVGLIGGEPTMHPQFKEICKLFQKYQFVKARRELWTNGYKFEKYRDIIEETFYPELISYNQHENQQPCWHQPVSIAIEEVFNGSISKTPKGFTDNEDSPKAKDAILMQKIIDNCWVQQRWSASVTPYGAYFCEVAAARAVFYGGKPKGISIEVDWWKRPQEDWEYQRKVLCKECSMCLPMPMIANDKQKFDEVSPHMLEVFTKNDSPKCAAGNCRTVDLESLREYYRGHLFEPNTEYRKRGSFKDFPKWIPWRYRQAEEIKHDPKDVLVSPGTRIISEGKG